MTTEDDVEVYETREGHLIVRSRLTGLSVVGAWTAIRDCGRTKVEEACRRMLARDIATRADAMAERAHVVSFLRSRVSTLADFVRDGTEEYGRTVHTAQILALHKAARLIELGAEEWTEQ